jgi:hypothetical protein
MPLISIWKTNPEAVAALSIEQVVATAGDGRLLTGSACSSELREFLSQVPSAKLAEYSEYCLANAFVKGGHILQDVVNELGRRLEYSVTNGLYQGTKEKPGFDGLWRSPDGGDLVIEVKTTDAYRISLDTVAAYRRKLIETSEAAATTHMLLIVGREDTGELEAQIRGSRHAWDMRVINIDARVKLVKLKESTDSPATGAKIRSVLVPWEYTKLDALVDVVFTAARDVEAAVDIDQTAGLDATPDGREESTGWQFTEPSALQAKRDAVVGAFAAQTETKLVQVGRARYWTADHKNRVVCTVSKRYVRRGHTPYWYALHPTWNDFLIEGNTGHLLLGCMDLDVAFCIPIAELNRYLDKLNTTVKHDGGQYWHLKIVAGKDGSYLLQLPKAEADVKLSTFSLLPPKNEKRRRKTG